MNESFKDCRADMYRLSGALLADDMGLGKTFMTLVALSEFMKMDAEKTGYQRPILGVMPVALLDNWRDEIGKTFAQVPFSDVIVLNGSTLQRFKARSGDETKIAAEQIDGGHVDASHIRYALKVGLSFGSERLDLPGRLVLTSYSALRQYQMSLGSIDWGVAFFDEAQNVKEPRTQVTNAARAIKAGFTLMATGTPVENSLRNIFTLFDIAQPGLLGSWEEFRKEWIVTKNSDDREGFDRERERVGARLRAHIGAFMLRRTKEEKLEGMPTKTIHSALEFKDARDVVVDPDLAGVMPEFQRQTYDKVIQEYKSSEDKGAVTLPTLHKLREVSLHPDIYLNHGSAWAAATSAAQGREIMLNSGRFIAALKILDRIQARNEKAIIFVINKKLQVALRIWMKALYGLDVHVVNGDVKTTTEQGRASDPTRIELIKNFESVQGFNVIVMSPLAAGVGLTVTGANHVIHLERHWNPAKEAQATDRVYRIGQTKPVHVYLPVSKHPNYVSFDEHLNSLLLTKTDVKNSVMAPSKNSEADNLAPMAILFDGK